MKAMTNRVCCSPS